MFDLNLKFMKSSQMLCGAAALLLIFAACSKKESEDETSDEWPEMDSFHMIIADAYHPFKDSANLAPAKKLAEEMALEAVRWQEAALPDKVSDDDMKKMLEGLRLESRAFADQVRSNVSDAELGNSLTTLHDSFHKIMEAWYGKGEK
jgi:hypothetical protein